MLFMVNIFNNYQVTVSQNTWYEQYRIMIKLDISVIKPISIISSTRENNFHGIRFQFYIIKCKKPILQYSPITYNITSEYFFFFFFFFFFFSQEQTNLII